MEDQKLRILIKEVVQEELKDLTKTLNRIYEDREDIGAIKTRVGTLEDLFNKVIAEIKKMRKDVTADVKDVHIEVKEVKDAISE